MVSNRKVMDRHRHVMLAFAFLFQYKRLRLQHQQGEGEGEGGRSKAKENEDYLQEVCFNLGRAFHQLNLLHLAVPFYEKAISTSPPRSSPYRSAFLSSDEAEERKKNEEEKEEEEKEAETRAREAFDLRREAAYNLSLIYQNSGSHQLAAKLLRTYCTI
ncbi:General transcription factor IIIC, polypeptide 3, variant 2 [Balamuthia mandrillaris]